MKKVIFILAIGLIFYSGCTGTKTISTGLENKSFLEFIGNPSTYSSGVDVLIDDITAFKAEVNKDHADRPKGNVYAISTGTHTIIVTYKDNVIYKKQIFVSAQETKKILLP
jgi:hypothetical protein